MRSGRRLCLPIVLDLTGEGLCLFCLEGHSDREILSLGAWRLQRLGRYSRLCLLCLDGHSDRENLALGDWGLQCLGKYSRLCFLCLEGHTDCGNLVWEAGLSSWACQGHEARLCRLLSRRLSGDEASLPSSRSDLLRGQ